MTYGQQAQGRRERIAAQRQDEAYLEKKARRKQLRAKYLWASTAAVLNALWLAQIACFGLAEFKVSSGILGPFCMIVVLETVMAAGVSLGMLLTARSMVD